MSFETAGSSVREMKKPLGTTIFLAACGAVFAAVFATSLSAVAQGFSPVSASPVGRGLNRAPQAQAPATSAAQGFSPAATLSKYCITCHNEKRKVAGLMIDKLDLQQVGADAEMLGKGRAEIPHA